MRRLLFIMIALSINLRTEAQKINSKIKNKRHTDTVQFFVGKKQITIIENTGNRWGIRKNNVKISKTSKFCGHWAGIDVGINGFAGEDYSVYNGYKFMDLYKLKSIGINLNILQYDIGLQQNRNTIGMVTGLGLESNNYRFDKKITIEKGETGIIQPELLYSDWEVKKSKLTTLYLTLPLFLEFQIPVNIVRVEFIFRLV